MHNRTNDTVGKKSDYTVLTADSSTVMLSYCLPLRELIYSTRQHSSSTHK